MQSQWVDDPEISETRENGSHSSFQLCDLISASIAAGSSFHCGRTVCHQSRLNHLNARHYHDMLRTALLGESIELNNKHAYSGKTARTELLSGGLVSDGISYVLRLLTSKSIGFPHDEWALNVVPWCRDNPSNICPTILSRLWAGGTGQNELKESSNYFDQL